MPIVIPDDLPYTPPGIECLRFGARRGGFGIGCCAVDVMQGFSNPPSAKCPQIPFFDGDSWTPEFYPGTDKQLCVGGDDITNEQVFLSYLTHGSFTPHPEADHGFLAILSEEQISSSTGRAWLTILKREGFQWVGCTSNSVYGGLHPNHVFALFRSTHQTMEDEEIECLKQPPKIWNELPEPTETPEERFNAFTTRFSQGGEAHTPAKENLESTEESQADAIWSSSPPVSAEF